MVKIVAIVLFSGAFDSEIGLLFYHTLQVLETKTIIFITIYFLLPFYYFLQHLPNHSTLISLLFFSSEFPDLIEIQLQSIFSSHIPRRHFSAACNQGIDYEILRRR